MSKLLLPLIILTGILVIGCAAGISTMTEEPNVPKPKFYNMDYEQVFSKAIDALNALAWQVTFTDKTNGVISAKASTWKAEADHFSIKISSVNNEIRVDASSSGRFTFKKDHSANIELFFKKLDALIRKDQSSN
jgi:hypothetical protein